MTGYYCVCVIPICVACQWVFTHTDSNCVQVCSYSRHSVNGNLFNEIAD